MDGAGMAVLTALVVLVALVVAVLLLVQQRRRRAGLQERFGPEYEREVDEQGDRRQAEKRLAEVAERRDRLEIRDLDPAERQRFTQQWTTVQAAFVDHPAAATRDADRLLGTVMRDRGYPVDDFESRAEMVAADHPEVVDHYRAAHAVGSRSGAANTEELRQAFVQYRELFEVLVEGDGTVDLRPHERTDRPSPG